MSTLGGHRIQKDSKKKTEDWAAGTCNFRGQFQGGVDREWRVWRCGHNVSLKPNKIHLRKKSKMEKGLTPLTTIGEKIYLY